MTEVLLTPAAIVGVSSISLLTPTHGLVVDDLTLSEWSAGVWQAGVDWFRPASGDWH